jgi:hypothetical protein
LTLAGTIDRRADGQALTVRLTAKLGRRHVLVVARPRVADGHLRLVVRLPARDRDPGDRWTFSIAYAGKHATAACDRTRRFLARGRELDRPSGRNCGPSGRHVLN